MTNTKKTKEDFRSLPREVRADRRKTAFEMMDEGYNFKEIQKRVKVDISTLYEWRKNRSTIEKNNYHGLKRGNPKDQKILSPKEQDEIVEAVKNTNPDDYGISYFLWSRKAIREFVIKKHNKTMDMRRISDYAKRWGFSSQRPTKYASEQDNEKITKWLEEDYPKIKEKAKKEKAEIHWADETNLNINTNYQKTYSIIGKTPIAKIPAKKTSYSMASSITNQGRLRYMSYKGGMNVKLFKIFLKRLIKDSDKKIFLILDNLRVHHAKAVREFEKENSSKLELFFPAGILPARQSR